MDIASTSSISADELLRLAASAESVTRHPLADSVASAAKHKGLQVPSSSDATTEPGAGVFATIDGKKVDFHLFTCFHHQASFLPSIELASRVLR